MNRTQRKPASVNGDAHLLRQSTAPAHVVPPLGVLMVGRRKDAWHLAAADSRPSLSDPLRLTSRNESESRVYRVYGFGEATADESWEFFYLLEVEDFDAWHDLQNRFEADGFRDYFECEVLALGRRLR